MQAFAAAWKAATAAEKVNPTDASLYITGIAARTRALTAFAAEISAKLPSQYDTACPGLNPATMVDFTCRAISHFCKEVRSIDVAASLAPVAQLSRDVRGAASSLPNTAVVDLAKALSAAVYNIGVKEVTDRRFGQAALLFEEACVVWESCFEQLLVPLSAILIAASELPSKSIAVVASIGKAMATEKGSSDGDGDVLTALLPSALARAQRWTIVTQLNSVQPPLLRFPRDLPQCILASPALHPMTEIVLTALGLPESGGGIILQLVQAAHSDGSLIPSLITALMEAGKAYPPLPVNCPPPPSAGVISRALHAQSRLLLLSLLGHTWSCVGDWRRALAAYRKGAELCKEAIEPYVLPASALCSAFSALAASVDALRKSPTPATRLSVPVKDSSAASTTSVSTVKACDGPSTCAVSPPSDVTLTKATAKRVSKKAVVSAAVVDTKPTDVGRGRRGAGKCVAPVEVTRAEDASTELDDYAVDGLTDAVADLTLSSAESIETAGISTAVAICSRLMSNTGDPQSLLSLAEALRLQSPSLSIYRHLQQYASICLALSLIDKDITAARDALLVLNPRAASLFIQIEYHSLFAQFCIKSSVNEAGTRASPTPCCCASILAVDEWATAIPSCVPPSTTATKSSKSSKPKSSSSTSSATLPSPSCLARCHTTLALSLCRLHGSWPYRTRDLSRQLAYFNNAVNRHDPIQYSDGTLCPLPAVSSDASACTDLNDSSFLIADSLAQSLRHHTVQNGGGDHPMHQFVYSCQATPDHPVTTSVWAKEMLTLPQTWTVCGLVDVPYGGVAVTRLSNQPIPVSAAAIDPVAGKPKLIKKTAKKPSSSPSSLPQSVPISPFGDAVFIPTLEAIQQRYADLIAVNIKQTSGNNANELSDWSEARKRAWWREREVLDAAFATAASELQQALGYNRAMMLGSLCNPATVAAIEGIVTDHLKECDGIMVSNPRLFRTYTHAVDVLSDDELTQALSSCCTSSGPFDDFAFASAISRLRALATSETTDWSRHPVILTLSEQWLHVPLESLPMYRAHKSVVTRMPSFSFILSAARTHRPLSSPPLLLHYLLNPGGDLPRTQAALTPVLTDIGNTHGIVCTGTAGRLGSGLIPCSPPAADDVTIRASDSGSFEFESEALGAVAAGGRVAISGSGGGRGDESEEPRTPHGLLYFGHGAGEKFLSVLTSHPSRWVLLMGCSSAAVKPLGRLDPEGPIWGHVSTGTRTTVGCLWDVTDKDIDRFSEHCLRSWLLGGEGEDGEGDVAVKVVDERLPASVASQRSVCRMPFAVGAAPVCYGLP